MLIHLRRNIRVCLAVAVSLMLSVALFAQEKPYYERVPFDSLTLKPDYGGGTFELLPLDFPNGIAPSPLPRTGVLIVSFVDEPDEKYEVDWQAVASIVTYHEAVFGELQQHLRRKDFDASYGYFDYMFRNVPKFPGLQAAYESMLITEAKQFLQNADVQNATARFERLYEENRDHAELKRLWGTQVESQLAHLMQAEDCDRMREMIAHFEERYPGNEIGKTWLAAIDLLAKNYVEKAQRAYADKQYLEAYDGIENARRVMADSEVLKDVEQILLVACPKILVGVSQMTNVSPRFLGTESRLISPDMPLAPLTDATIRSQRLLRHDMVEYSGSGIDGGIYDSPIGMFSKSKNGFEWVLHDDLKWADGAPITAYDMAETLERLFFPQNVSHDRKPVSYSPTSSAAGDGDTADTSGIRFVPGSDYMTEGLFQSIDIPDHRTVVVQLNGEWMFPESRLRVPLSRANSFAFMGSSFVAQENASEMSDEIRNWNGPYFLRRFDSRMPERNLPFDRAFYLRNVNDPFSTHDEPCLLIEQSLTADNDPLQLLLEGKIDVLEHVPPDQVQVYRMHRQIVVGKYAAPRLHFLLPNRNKPTTSSRTFLRGMLYGLDRDWMLRQLLGENTFDGTLLSAPIPKRTKPDDPFGYAYNDRVLPRPYEPKLAVALSVTAYNQVKNRELLKQQQRLAEQKNAEAASTDRSGEQTNDNDQPVQSPETSDITAKKRDLSGYLNLVPDELVIACPPNDTARKACLMIQQQWRTVGIPVRVVEYRANEPIGRGTDVDFWYVEMTMLEPYVDLELLFGSNGMVTNRSTYLELAMSRVRAARDWRETIEALEYLHRTIHDETAVLPLWQINMHFAHRRELSGVSGELFRLYDQIEQWQPTQSP